MTAQRDSIHIDELDVPPAPAFTDQASAAVLDEAVTELVLLRFPASIGDAAAELHALTALILQAQARLPNAVARALDQDYDWRDIACCLNRTTASTRRRYRPREERSSMDA